MATQRIRKLVVLGVLVFAAASFLPAQEASGNNGESLSTQQKEAFLLNAKVIKSMHTAKGVTEPWWLTLSDGTITHDGNFQPIDEMKPQMQFADGHVEYNFKDSYHYNIAGYELAKLVGLDNMVPLTVARTWNGMKGSLSWRVSDYMMDEGDRMQKNLDSPDPDGWNKQMYKIRVFDELVYDTDPNLTNVLITKDWKIWRVDFSRAFRSWKKLRNPGNLVMCDKNLFEKLKALNEADLKTALNKQVSSNELKGLLARRDLIVEAFNKLIADKGESAVLY